MDWIIANKEWVFSGIGVFALASLISLYFRKNSGGGKGGRALIIGGEGEARGGHGGDGGISGLGGKGGDATIIGGKGNVTGGAGGDAVQ